MTAEGILAGRTVLITRPGERARDVVSALEALGAQVLLEPTIAFEPPTDPVPSGRAIEAIDSYDLVVFTSPTGAGVFSKLLGAGPEGVRRMRGRIVAIGPGTARALADMGLPAELVASDSRAEGLAALLGTLPLAGTRVLIVRPEAARDLLPDGLQKSGAHVDSIAFYRTVAASGAGAAAAALARGGIDAIVFTSPSTFHCLVEAGGPDREGLRAALGRTRRVAIGPATAAALEGAGLPADVVAASPTRAALVEALVCALRR